MPRAPVLPKHRGAPRAHGRPASGFLSTLGARSFFAARSKECLGARGRRAAMASARCPEARRRRTAGLDSLLGRVLGCSAPGKRGSSRGSREDVDQGGTARGRPRSAERPPEDGRSRLGVGCLGCAHPLWISGGRRCPRSRFDIAQIRPGPRGPPESRRRKREAPLQSET